MEQFNSSINVFSIDSRYVNQEIDYLNGITVESASTSRGSTAYIKEEGNVEIKEEYYLDTGGQGQLMPGMIDVGLVAATEEVETMYDGTWNEQLQQVNEVEIQFADNQMIHPNMYELQSSMRGRTFRVDSRMPRPAKIIKMLKVPKMMKIPGLMKLPNYPMISTLTGGHVQGQDKSLEMVAHLLRVDKPTGNGKLVRVWQCGVCRREFFNRYTLVRHMPTHTDERHFMCDTCGKAFRQASTLAQHRAIHSNARPYVCPQCQKSFNRASSLISHKKTHAAVKQHVCKFCGKGFHQKGNLRNHEFTHTDARPYVCDLCGKGFNQRSNLVCHKDRLHKMEPAKFIFGI